MLIAGDEVHQCKESSVAAAVTCGEKALMGCDRAQRIIFGSHGHALSNVYSNAFEGCWPNARTGPSENYIWDTLSHQIARVTDCFRIGWNCINFLQRTSVHYAQDHLRIESPLDFSWKYTVSELKLIPSTQITMHTFSHAKFVSSPARGKVGLEEPFEIPEFSSTYEITDSCDDDDTLDGSAGVQFENYNQRIGFSSEVFHNILYEGLVFLCALKEKSIWDSRYDTALKVGLDGVPISTMFWGNHYVDLLKILVRIVFDDAEIMRLVGLDGSVDDVKNWWVVTTPDSFSGEKSMLAQPCGPLPRVAVSSDCLGNLKSDERRNVAYTRGVHFKSIYQLWECFNNNGYKLAEPWVSHYNCVFQEDPSYINYLFYDCRAAFPRIEVDRYGLSSTVQNQIWGELQRLFGNDMRTLIRQYSYTHSTPVPRSFGAPLHEFLWNFAARFNEAAQMYKGNLKDASLPARNPIEAPGSYKWCYGSTVDIILPTCMSLMEDWRPNVMKEVTFRYSNNNAFVVVSFFCADVLAWNGVDVASSVVSVGRCLLRLVFNYLLLEKNGAVKLVPHKRQSIANVGFRKVIHQCNTLRDATVVGLWSELKQIFENATYMYLGGGTDHHPPYVYSLVFREVAFPIAYTLAAIVLALSSGSVDKRLFYSVSETISQEPDETSDFEKLRDKHMAEVQSLLDILDINDLMQGVTAETAPYESLFDFDQLPETFD